MINLLKFGGKVLSGIKAMSTTDLLNPALWLSEWSGTRRTKSGSRVNQNTALSLSTYYSCIKNISEDISKLPLGVYQKDNDDDGNEVITCIYDHPLTDLLQNAPNPEMTAIVFRETMQHWACGWGNGLAEIERFNSGAPKALWPIHPSRWIPQRGPDGKIYYKVLNGYTGLLGDSKFTTEYLPAEDVIHLRGLGPVGLYGYSVMQLAAESIGVSLAAQTFGATFFGNGAMAGGVLEHPGKLDDVAFKHLRQSWEERHRGPDNGHRIDILEEGMKYNPVSIPPNEAQFLETREFQVEEICRWFRMPPHKIQHLKRATFSNIESQSMEYAGDTLMPWMVRWEQELAAKTLSPSERAKKLFFHHDTTILLRGDQQARAAFYQTMFLCGAFSPNDIRSRERLNPIDGGDLHFVQSQNIPLTMVESNVKSQQTQTPVEESGVGTTGKGPEDVGAI